MLYKLQPQIYFQLNFPEEFQAAQQVVMQQQQAQMAAQGGAPQPQGGGAPPMPQQPPGSTGGVPANPSLASVPLPHWGFTNELLTVKI